jgi:oxalate decarboxylase/phosphoglucose isomerase-like protein (cupin superfamily)
VKNTFALMQSIPREFAGGAIYRAEQQSFPALVGLSLNVTHLERGAIREPHVCPNAARINYVIAGDGRVGILGPGGEKQVIDVIPGNVTFVPQGYVHWIENTGDELLKYLTAFSHEQPVLIELSEILSATPNPTLSKTFALSDDVVSSIPSRPVVIGGEGY